MEQSPQHHSIEVYAEFVKNGYARLGPSTKDVKAMGGYEKAKGYLHNRAAYELMEADPLLTERQARELVTKIAEDILRYPPEE